MPRYAPADRGSMVVSMNGGGFTRAPVAREPAFSEPLRQLGNRGWSVQGGTGQFRQVLQGCGPWRLNWVPEGIPKSVRSRVADGSTLLVFPSRMVESQLTDSDRAAAQFEGYVTKLGTTGISGWEASWLLQKPSGAGPGWSAGGFATSSPGPTDDYFDTKFPMNGITLGDVSAADVYVAAEDGISGPAQVRPTGETRWPEFRTYLDRWAGKCERATSDVYSWRINPGLTLDFDEHDILFSVLGTVVSNTGLATVNDDGLNNVLAALDATRSIEEVASTIEAFGNTDVDGTTIDEWTETQTIAFNAPDGSALDIRQTVNGTSEQTTEYTLEQIALKAASFAVATTAASIRARHRSVHEVLNPGDQFYIHDGDLLTDDANSVNHFGNVIHPMKMWVNVLMWNAQEHNSVVARTPAGVFVDLTPYVQFGTDEIGIEASTVWAPKFQQSTNGGTTRLGGNSVVADRLASVTINQQSP